MNILIYSPPPRTSRSLQTLFRQHGLHIETCDDAETCMTISMTSNYDALIYLDQFDPKLARDFFSRWKAEGCSSMFVLVTRNPSGVERGRNLELGMDICVIEPCSFSDLIIDMTRQRLRKAFHDRGSISTNLFRVDILSRTILYRGSVLSLSKTEFAVLYCFIRRRGTVLSRLQIWEEAWGEREYPIGNSVDVQVARLRKKLQPLNLIQSVHGIGYRMRGDS